MDVLKLLEEIEDILDSAASIPLSQKVLVDKKEILELVKDIRVQLPDEIKQAKWIKDERQKIIVEAQNEADTMLLEANKHINSLVEKDEITKQANAKAEQIIAQAKGDAKEMRLGARHYADEVLGDVEGSLSSLITTVQKNREELKGMK
ncbi:ATPase [Serpentinicella sp. ANB-PHB4]|uniref:ATPase n=1 Tax=Serpentinicella sp. ANB-PHB4 TaxID=3074076 RepID=UPI0028549D97|nr:ATPase [Serpentinicella sp. ANB-PHB4]MDR5658306.1 ATPase [Serpentinicella sp. ANB-PHB4]